MYHQRVAVPENREQALKWYHEPADQGSEERKKALSLME
jgi:TPR repeat protein